MTRPFPVPHTAHPTPRVPRGWLAKHVRSLLVSLALALSTPDATADPTNKASAPPASRRPPAPAREGPWSWQPLRRPAVPPPATPDHGRPIEHPVDAFVAARLAPRGLALGPEADRVTLIRRLTFDLVGLPPSPAEIEAFANDPDPRAHDRLVDRLLASPHYGERWGRHWLDLARYTESQGFEYDRLRDRAWHYRDYVIRSFNEDKPYDRFMREQIAGDVLEPPTSDGLIATSFLVCGPYDEAGNNQANATQKAITREEELEDLVAVVSQTFLGLTVNCARCHAHKFDPITLDDYYRFKSVFEGIRHGERPIATPDQAGAGRELPVSYVGTRMQPPPTRRLERGDVRSPGEVVAPGALAALEAVPSDFGLAPDAPEAERRRTFAAWLTDPRNPLPARVMVNRIWQHHFGQGLVATPNDFGAAGSPPTHPELLDWLADRFMADGWSVKSLHRLIVSSATYRQSSRHDPRAAALDADNRLLWRYPPRRLDAEGLRDALLAASGELNPSIGGPSFRPFEVLAFPANAYRPIDRPEPEFNRRTVYRMNVNSGKEPLLDAFDCPDPAVKTPRRGATTTPLQALALMNNSFVRRQAEKLAERSLAEAGGRFPEAVAIAYRRTLGREPSDAERRRALEAGEASEPDLARLAWVLFNSTEFVYVR